MPFLPTVEYSCCGFSLRLGVVLSTWFFLMVDVSILVIYLMEAISAPGEAGGKNSSALDIPYLLRAHHSPLDAFESSRSHIWNAEEANEASTRKQSTGHELLLPPRAPPPPITTTTENATLNIPVMKPRGVLLAQVPIAVYFIAVDIMLLLGVWSDSRVLLVTWMWATGGRACLELVVMVATVVRWVGARVAPPSVALRLMLRLVIVLCEGYCVIVTYSYYRLTSVLSLAYENHHALQTRTSGA